MRGIHVNYSRNTTGHIIECSRCICLRAYAINVECMYTSADGPIVDSSEFTVYTY